MAYSQQNRYDRIFSSLFEVGVAGPPRRTVVASLVKSGWHRYTVLKNALASDQGFSKSSTNERELFAVGDLLAFANQDFLDGSLAGSGLQRLPFSLPPTPTACRRLGPGRPVW